MREQLKMSLTVGTRERGKVPVTWSMRRGQVEKSVVNYVELTSVNQITKGGSQSAILDSLMFFGQLSLIHRIFNTVERPSLSL